MQINKMEISPKELTAIKEEKSRILAETSISEANYRKNGDLKDLEIIQKYKRQLQALQPKEARADAELKLDIDRASKFTKEISKETDGNKILEMVTDDDDIQKSSVFNLEELWTQFNSFDGITKLTCIMMFSSYFILSCVFGITSTIYGNYLIERFKLEEKYPRLAKYINYRKKLSKFYIISDVLIIVLVCCTNMLLGLSIISIYI